MKTKKMYSNLIVAKMVALLLFISIACNTSNDKKTMENQSPVKSEVKVPNEDIFMAIISGHQNIVEQHIKAGTNVNQKEQMSGSTPLMTAITFNKPEIAQMLIDAGSDLSIKNNDGSTALHSAAFLCRIEIVQMLLNANANKKLTNTYGLTPKDIVTSDFSEVKPVYEFIIQQLQPMGFTLDLEEIKKARPVVAMMLTD